MSNILEEMRKRTMKMREIHNQYKLGLHPFLKDPDAPIVKPPKESRSDTHDMDIRSEDTKSPGKGFLKDSSGGDEEAKTKSSNRRKYFDDFHYNDVLEDCFVRPFLDDEDWISSDTESEEEYKNSQSKKVMIGSEDTKNQSESFFEESIRLNEEGSSSDEERKTVNPEKVNWLKFITNKYFDLDSQSNESGMMLMTVVSDILELLLSEKTDEMIQENLFNIVGGVTELNGKSIDPIEMCMELLSKREYIREYCSTLSNSIGRKKKNQNTGHNPYQYSVGVTVTYTDPKGKKGRGKGQKTKASTSGRASNHELLAELGFSSEFVDENYKLGLKPRGQFTSSDFGEPYVTKKRHAREFKSGAGGTKAGYKQDTFDEPDWKEVHLTPPKKHESQNHDLISIKSLPEWMRPAFSGTDNLNTIQSIVFESAFNTTNNVLVAAPTGAGKTNIALLTILREVKKYINTKEGEKEPSRIDMTDKSMKIVYLAPLKALAAEIVGKFSHALGYLKIKVREMTGDMNLTKQELKETHIIVSTPEKWDVVTRKNDELMTNLNLMIIDEIHLLNDERGTVLE